MTSRFRVAVGDSATWYGTLPMDCRLPAASLARGLGRRPAASTRAAVGDVRTTKVARGRGAGESVVGARAEEEGWVRGRAAVSGLEVSRREMRATTSRGCQLIAEEGGGRGDEEGGCGEWKACV
jgi:hypothetical protein